MGAVAGKLREFGGMTIFAVDAIRNLPGSVRYTSEILRQCAILVKSSTLVIAFMAMTIGFSQTNFGYYILRAAGAADFTGLVSGLATPRISGGFIFGYIFAAKVGCGLTAEIGAMRVNEELDAFESEGVNPMRYVVGTRLAGALLYTPIAAGVALLADTFGSYLNAIVVLHALPSAAFFRYHWGIQAVPDQLFAFVVLVTCAVTILLVCAFYGFRVSGGPAEVGRAVAASLVVNIVLVNMITGVLEFLVYQQDPKLPIGG